MKIERFSEMIEEIHRDRGIPRETLVEAIRFSLLSAAKKIIKEDTDFLDATITDDGEVKIILKKDDTETDVTPHDFGRLAAQAAKQVILHRIREAEREGAYEEFAGRGGELITGTIQKRERSGYLINLGRIETILPPSDQIPGEIYREGDRIRLYVVEVIKTTKGPYIVVSRAHPGLIQRLFELEVPEIKEGILEIKAIAREPGRRTKIAVFSNDEKIGAVGTCVGQMGVRIQNIVKELGPERVDIVEWKADPAAFIVNALSPAKVVKLVINEEKKSANVYILQKDLSLAIGKEGQNVRLAGKLTGYNINVFPESDLNKEAKNAN